MRSEMSHVFGWFAAAAIAVVFMFFLFKVSFETALCSGPEDLHCLRDWVSALGGWVGGIATFATLFYLARQVWHTEETRSLEKQQRLMEFEHLGLRAEHAAEMAQNAMKRLREYALINQTGAVDEIYIAVDALAQAVRDVVSVIEDPAFEDIERHMFLGGLSIRTVRYSLLRSVERLSSARRSSYPTVILVLQEERRLLRKQDYEIRYFGLVARVGAQLARHELPR